MEICQDLHLNTTINQFLHLLTISDILHLFVSSGLGSDRVWYIWASPYVPRKMGVGSPSRDFVCTTQAEEIGWGTKWLKPQCLPTLPSWLLTAPWLLTTSWLLATLPTFARLLPLGKPCSVSPNWCGILCIIAEWEWLVQQVHSLLQNYVGCSAVAHYNYWVCTKFITEQHCFVGLHCFTRLWFIVALFYRRMRGIAFLYRRVSIALVCRRARIALH